MHQLHQPQFYPVELGSIIQIRINSPGISKGSPFDARVPLPGQGCAGTAPVTQPLFSREIKHSELPFPAWLWLLTHSAAEISQDSPREGNGLN